MAEANESEATHARVALLNAQREELSARIASNTQTKESHLMAAQLYKEAAEAYKTSRIKKGSKSSWLWYVLKKLRIVR